MGSFPNWLVCEAGVWGDEPGGAEERHGAGRLAPHVEEEGEGGPLQSHLQEIKWLFVKIVYLGVGEEKQRAENEKKSANFHKIRKTVF